MIPANILLAILLFAGAIFLSWENGMRIRSPFFNATIRTDGVAPPAFSEEWYGKPKYNVTQHDPVALLRTIANDTARHDATLAELGSKMEAIHLLVGKCLAILETT